jgi:hypothetical protein
MQEHIRRAHPDHYLPKLPATEESFLLMVNTPPVQRDHSLSTSVPGSGPSRRGKCTTSIRPTKCGTLIETQPTQVSETFMALTSATPLLHGPANELSPRLQLLRSLWHNCTKTIMARNGNQIWSVNLGCKCISAIHITVYNHIHYLVSAGSLDAYLSR